MDSTNRHTDIFKSDQEGKIIEVFGLPSEALFLLSPFNMAATEPANLYLFSSWTSVHSSPIFFIEEYSAPVAVVIFQIILITFNLKTTSTCPSSRSRVRPTVVSGLFCRGGHLGLPWVPRLSRRRRTISPSGAVGVLGSR